MKVVYTGPIDAVDLPLSDGTLIVAGRGEPVEVPDEFAASLLEQDEIWRPAQGATTDDATTKDGE